MILTHPENKDYFKFAAMFPTGENINGDIIDYSNLIPTGEYCRYTEFPDSVEIEFNSIIDFPIEWTTSLPSRATAEYWEPPPAERFIEYGPEDEAWAKPLGLGTVQTVDLGPYIVHMQEEMMRKLTQEVLKEGLNPLYSEIEIDNKSPSPILHAMKYDFVITPPKHLIMSYV